MMIRTALLLVALATVGCSTVEGFGEDVQATGQAVSDTAEEAREEM